MKVVTVNLTPEQANSLICYILASTQYREREQKSCKELSEERNEDGTVKYPNAAENAKYWEALEDKLTEIRTILENGKWGNC
jgi:hypothetical protein